MTGALLAVALFDGFCLALLTVLIILLRRERVPSVESTHVAAGDLRKFVRMLDEKHVADETTVPLTALLWELPK